MTTFRAQKRRVLLGIVLWLIGLTVGYEDESRLAEAASQRQASTAVDSVRAAGTAASPSGVAPLKPPPRPPAAGGTAEALPPVGAPGALPLDPARAALVEQAKADLARRQSAAADAMTLIEIRSVVWPDRGLGCPRPGVEHLQVPVDGFLIRLGLGGRVFDYHQGRGRPPFLCERSG